MLLGEGVSNGSVNAGKDGRVGVLCEATPASRGDLSEARRDHEVEGKWVFLISANVPNPTPATTHP